MITTIFIGAGALFLAISVVIVAWKQRRLAKLEKREKQRERAYRRGRARKPVVEQHRPNSVVVIAPDAQLLLTDGTKEMEAGNENVQKNL
jgi:hypothetical protein